MDHLFRLAIIVALFTPPARADSKQPAHHYFYFKEKRELVLDTTRIAVKQSEASRHVRSAALLASYGFADRDVVASDTTDWSIARIRQNNPARGDIANLVTRLASDEAFNFASPVFEGDDGATVIIAPVVLVRFEPDIAAERAEAVLLAADAGTIKDRNFAGMRNLFRTNCPAKNGFEVLRIANELAMQPEVRFAEPDMMIGVRPDFIPNDPGFSNCWGLRNTGQYGGTPGFDMDAPDAWDISAGDTAVIVVVLDVGIQQDHPDINQLTPGTDTAGIGGDGGPRSECDNHGTTVAGCVSATINNALGTVGVAPGCRVASARIATYLFGCNESPTTFPSWVANGLDWAESIGARVTNNSSSIGFESSTIADKYAETRDAGIVHFASAGNESEEEINFPASLDSVNAVAAVNPFGDLAYFSNSGLGLAFSAPGQQIYTTDRTGMDGYVAGDYTLRDGTSFSSPYAAGVAALMLSVDPNLAPTDVESIMQQTCVDLGDAGYDTTYGWGLVNARNAILAARTECQPQQRAHIAASDPGQNDHFGFAVSLSGDTAVVGAPGNDAVYVFVRNGSNWAQQARLAGTESFGFAVALSGNTLAVGAPDASPGYEGAAYVFVRNAGTWVQQSYLSPNPGGDSNAFGQSLSLSGSTLLVSEGWRGIADVFIRTGANWIRQATLTGGIYVQHLFSVAISGNTAVLCGFTTVNEFDDYDGVCDVFSRSNGVWTQQSTLYPSDSIRDHDAFGYSVAISTDTIVVGAPYHSISGVASAGSVYVFVRNNGSWSQQATLAADDLIQGSQFGYSVAISGDICLIGANHNWNNQPSTAYVFVRSGSVWTLQAKLIPTDSVPADAFGSSVWLSGDTAIVGANLDDAAAGVDAGTAYIFSVNCDINGDGIPDNSEPVNCPCGDFNADNLVSLVDFVTFQVCFGALAPNVDCPAEVFACADLNADGAVNLIDFVTFQTIFGLTPDGVAPPDCLSLD